MHSHCSVPYSIPATIALLFSFLTLVMTHEGEVARLTNALTVMCISRRKTIRIAPGTSAVSGSHFMCSSLVKLMAVMLNITCAVDLRKNEGMRGISMLDSSFRFHLVHSTSEIPKGGESPTVSHLLLPQRELAPTMGLFLLMSVCPPTTAARVRASQAGEKNRLWLFTHDCSLAHAHKPSAALHGHQRTVPNQSPAPRVGHAVGDHGWCMALGCSHIWSLSLPAPCCLPQAEYPSHKPLDIIVV